MRLSWVCSWSWLLSDEGASRVSCLAPASSAQPVFLVAFLTEVPYPGAYMCAEVKTAGSLSALQNIRAIGAYLDSVAGKHWDPGVFQVLSRALCSKGRGTEWLSLEGNLCSLAVSIPCLSRATQSRSPRTMSRLF